MIEGEKEGIANSISIKSSNITQPALDKVNAAGSLACSYMTGTLTGTV